MATAEEALDAACHRLMSEPGLAPLLAWWAGDLCRAVPAGPVDPLRLAMAQGDRERLSAVQFRAAQHVKRKNDAAKALAADGPQPGGRGGRRAAGARQRREPGAGG